jgi:hypothetical protein
MTSKGKEMLYLLIKYALRLFDDSDSEKNEVITIFFERYDDILKAKAIFSDILLRNSKENKRLHFSKIDDFSLYNGNSLFIIYNPDNIDTYRKDLLEDVEAICFHGALNKIPTIMINPTLIATAWNNFGPRPPLLLSDFAQVYFICDDYFMISRNGEWCGLVQRAATGLDVYILSGVSSRKSSPDSFVRIESYEDGIADNIRSRISKYLMKASYFPDLSILSRKRTKVDEASDHCDNMVDMNQINNAEKHEHHQISIHRNITQINSFTWKNIKPAL